MRQVRENLLEIFPRTAIDAFDQLRAGILFTDHQSRVIHANRRLCEIFGLNLENLQDWDQNTFLTIHQTDVEAAHGQRDVRVELVLNGVRCAVLVSTSEVGRDLLMSVIQDVTRILSGYDQVVAELNSLKEKMASIISDDMIHICMNCKKVRLKDGAWIIPADSMPILKNHLVSHGFCPACAEDYFRKNFPS